MSFERHSERTGPFGGFAAEGMINTLGCPPFDRLTLVIREATQNAWDARRSRLRNDDSIPRLMVRIRTLSPEQADAFKRLFSDRGDEPAIKNELAQRLASPKPVPVLELCDFGTTGLRGPVDPRQPLDGRPNNFRNFFFDVGVAHPGTADGGTYGYGRSSLYLASGARTILVDSLALEEEGMQRRLMACRMGHAYEKRSFLGPGLRYTGRHFWGRKDDDGIAPLLDDAASDVSQAIGLPQRSAGESGTSILIPWPQTDEPIKGSWIVETMLCHLWPKMVSALGPHAMHFSVFDGDNQVSIPQVRTHRIYGPFASALLAARDRSAASGAQEIRLQRPDVVTGHLALEVGDEAENQGDVDASEDRFSSPLIDGSHHVALMRPTELVVRYLDVPGARHDGRSWAGVFLCDPGVQDAFAQSEPPAHDDWLPQRLEDKNARRLVNRTVCHLIPSAVKDRFGTARRHGRSGASDRSLALVADTFARGFLTGPGSAAAPGGPGAGEGSGGASGSGSGSRGPRAQSIQFENLRVSQGLRVASYRVSIVGVTRPVLLTGVLAIAVDELRHGELEVPDVLPPEFIGWRDAEQNVVPGPTMRLAADATVTMEVAFHGEYGLSVSCEVSEL